MAIDGEVNALVRDVAGDMAGAQAELAGLLHEKLASGISELSGDPVILDLLFGSIASNLDSFVQTIRAGAQFDDLSAPSAAFEYARRLAQRGVTPNALLRAYRLGQAAALMWALDRVEHTAPDSATAAAASARFVELSFGYIDAISEQVVREYDSERARWLTHRNAESTAALRAILADEPIDVAASETVLGYRLRQHHLAVVVWRESDVAGAGLSGLEQVVRRVAKAAGSVGPPLFAPQDQNMMWAWLPFGRSSDVAFDAAELNAILSPAGVRLAAGAPASGPDGFRRTHTQALAVSRIVGLAGTAAPSALLWTHPEIPAAVMLSADPPGARELVRAELGALADTTEAAERLRDSLRVFLANGGAYVAGAKALHIHLNTMKYRVARAVELRGRPFDENRLNLELALIACRWLPTVVLA